MNAPRRPLFVAVHPEDELMTKIRLALGLPPPLTWSPSPPTESDKRREKLLEAASAWGRETSGIFIRSYNYPLQLMAGEFGLDTPAFPSSPPPYVPDEDRYDPSLPLWLVAAFWWEASEDDILEWKRLTPLRAHAIKGQAVYRRMKKKLQPYLKERAQDLFLATAMFAIPEPGPKAVAQIFLRMAVDAGLPKMKKRLRGKG